MLAHRWCGALFQFGTGLVLGNVSCTVIPPPAASVAAADPAARVAPTRYRAVTPAAGTFTPAEPEPWQDRNLSNVPESPPKGRGP